LYWQFKTEAVVIDGSSYQATSWRTIPDYQGGECNFLCPLLTPAHFCTPDLTSQGFLLDGGVHFAAMLRTVLPDYAVPATVISTSALHRSHIPPHDTVQGICLPAKESTTEPHGPPTALNTINDLKDIPGGTGKSAPTGSILLSWALPDTPPETRAPGGLTVTTLNGVVEITNVNRVWTLRVIPAAGSDVKPREETSPADGVERELEAFVKTVRAVQQGTEDEVQARGYPTGPLWDVAFIQALLSSGGSPVDIKQLLGN
jgi:predicted dehydrogenase